MTALWIVALAGVLGINPVLFALLCCQIGLQFAILVVVAVRR